MARGQFDPTQLSLGWFDPSMRGVGQFDASLLEVGASGGTTLTAAPGTSSWVVVPANITRGGISLTVAPPHSTWVDVAAAITKGGLTLTITPPHSTWVDLAASLTKGGISLSPSPAISTWTVPNPIITVPVTLHAGPAVSSWTASNPSLSSNAALRIELYQGPTLIATWNTVPTASALTESFDLTPTQIASITDWTDLRVRLSASATSGRVRVTQVYLQAPGLTGPVLVVTLYQGGTQQIAEWEVQSALAARTEVLDLSPAEVASITDWGNLRVTLTAYAPTGRIRVTDLYVQAPAPSANPIATPAPAVSRWTVPSPAMVVPIGLTAAPAVGSWTVQDPFVRVSTAETLSAVPAISGWVVPAPSLTRGGTSIAGSLAITRWTVRAGTVSGGLASGDVYAWFPGDRGPAPPEVEQAKEQRTRTRGPRRIPRALRQQLPSSYPPPSLSPAPAPQVQPMQPVAQAVMDEPVVEDWHPHAVAMNPEEEEEEELLVVLLALHGR